MSKTQDEKLAEELINDAKSLGIDTDEILNKDEEEKKPEDLGSDEKKSEEEKEEKSKDETKSDDTKKSEEEGSDKSKSRIPKKEEGKDEDDDTSGDDDESDEEDKSKEKKPKLVPYKKVRKLKEKHKQEIAELQDQLKKATTKEEVDDVEQAIQEFAKKTEANPEVVKELISIIQKAGAKSAPKKEEDEDLDDLDEDDDDSDEEEEAPKIDLQAEKEYFDNEWKTYLPKLQEQYPNLTDGQLAKAKDLMDKLSHTKQYVAIPDLNYILFKEQGKFDEILKSPKKKGIDSSDASMKREEIIDEDLSTKDLESMSAEDILKLDSKMKNIQRQHSSTKLLDM